MKKSTTFLVLISLLLSTLSAKTQGQALRFPDKEFLVTKLHTHYHFQDTPANTPGLNYAIEAGYSGKIYALLGFERFSALKGGVIDGVPLKGYTSFNGSIGLNLTHGYFEQWQYNAGIRLVKAYRGPLKENRFRPFIGWEAAVIHQFNNGLGLGVRGTLDNRQDQDIFNWNIENTFSAFFTITYKIIQL